MSTLSITLTAETNYIIQPAETVTLNGQVTISNIVDNPADQTVHAEVEGVGILLLDDLSLSNYGDWSQAEVGKNVKKLLTS